MNEKKKVGRPVGCGNVYIVTFPNNTYMTFSSRNQLSKTFHISPNIVTKSLKENNGKWHGLQFCLITDAKITNLLNNGSTEPGLV